MKNVRYLKNFIKYSSMNVLGMIGLSCYILADTFFVAKGLGANGLAALNLAIPVYSFVHGTGLMFGMGGATWYSILRGSVCDEEEKKIKCNAVFSHTMFLVMLAVVVFCHLGMFWSEVLTGLLGAEGLVFDMSCIYLKIILLFSPFFLVNDVLLCFVRNDGAPGLAMAAMLAGSFSNIILDYVFIFPLDMGIFGAVFATGIAPVISMLVLSSFFIRKKNHFGFLRSNQDFYIWKTICSLGLSSLVTEVSSGLVIVLFNWITLGLQGNLGVAAYGVTANLSLVILSIYTGIAQGIQPLLSRYHGLGEKEGVRIIFRYAVRTVAFLSVILYLFIFTQTDGIVAVFNGEGNQKLQEIAVYGMRIYFTACFFAAMNIIFSVYYASIKCAKTAGLISILRGFVVIIPMTFLLSFVWDMTGLWLAFPVTEMVVMAVALWVYRNQYFMSFRTSQKSNVEK